MIVSTHSPRIERTFKACTAEHRAALVTFIMAGDPSAQMSAQMLSALVASGSDIIELGMPFTDPMADGVTIQEAGRRALAAGQTLSKTLEMVRDFRAENTTTPLILMGYYNPIYHFGGQDFLVQAKQAGVDGLIIVDLPIEEDHELRDPTVAAGLDFIRLTTPTTRGPRLKTISESATGFIYHIGIAGITGAGAASQETLAAAVADIRSHYAGPVCVGFGIKTPDDVAQAAQVADGVVVGSAIIERIAAGNTPEEVGCFVASLRTRVKKPNKETTA